MKGVEARLTPRVVRAGYPRRHAAIFSSRWNPPCRYPGSSRATRDAGVLRRERPQLVHREDHRADREQRAADLRRRVLGDAAADRLAEIGGARAVHGQPAASM
jgi:hypothetical protein